MRTARPYSTRGVPLIHGVGRPSAAETTCATMLFADLHGYDALVEKLPPIQVVGLLEQFFDTVTNTVLEVGGQVLCVSNADMMAGFGVGDLRHTQIDDAIAAACRIHERFMPIRTSWQIKHAIDAGVGIGIHRGEVAVGLFGGPKRTAVVLVGDAANIAVQLCKRARVGEVLLSSAVYFAPDCDSVGAAPVPPMPFLHLPELQLRGRRTTLDVWCIPSAARLRMRHAIVSGHVVHH